MSTSQKPNETEIIKTRIAIIGGGQSGLTMGVKYQAKKRDQVNKQKMLICFRDAPQKHNRFLLFDILLTLTQLLWANLAVRKALRMRQPYD